MAVETLGRFTLALAITSMFFAGCAMTPKTTLVDSDIPVTVGTTFSGYQNSSAAATRTVSFDLKGPWDFTQTHGDAVVSSRIIKVSQAPAHDLYKSATYVEQVLPSRQTGGLPAYNFAALSASDLKVYGQSATADDGDVSYRIYDKQERLLIFPLRVGSKWVDDLVARDAPKKTYRVSREVVGRGEVKTPAGAFFDCFMVRAIREPTGANGEDKTRSIMYVWWAPGVGPVAAIGSLPDEPKLVFTEATYVWRLKSYKIAD